jgi:pantoate kinase
VEYASFGGIATEDVLDDAGALAAVSAAAEDAFPRFDPGAPLPALFDVAWTFARSTGLATDRVRKAVERVGDGSTMAMVGETVVAAGTDGALPERTRITPQGAGVLDG